MKKILAFLLGLILTLAVLFVSFEVPFSEIKPTDAPTVDPTAAPTPPPTSTIPPVIELPMSAIVLTEQIESSKNDNNVVYFTYSYPNTRLYLQDEAISAAVMLDLLNQIDSTRANADTLREQAQSIAGAGCFYQVRYIPQRIDGAVLSLSTTMVSFSGAAHPGSTCGGITYDLLTGNRLTLDDILTDACTADALCRLVVDSLSSIDRDELLYDDFSTSVEERFSGNYLVDESWHLSPSGLCFTFEPYEVGPYSSGIVTAVIPYAQLPGYLEDAYFPMEQISAPGRLTVTDYEVSDPDLDLNMAEVILDPDAPALLIQTEGVLYNVTIQTPDPQSSIVFAADQLTAGNAILLRGNPGYLQISYTLDGETITQPISLT